MNQYVPRFIARWVVDLTLRMVYLCSGKMPLNACKYNFMWTTWEDPSLISLNNEETGVTQARKLIAPAWSRIGTVRETRVTMADGYYYQSYSDGKTL